MYKFVAARVSTGLTRSLLCSDPAYPKFWQLDPPVAYQVCGNPFYSVLVCEYLVTATRPAGQMKRLGTGTKAENANLNESGVIIKFPPQSSPGLERKRPERDTRARVLVANDLESARPDDAAASHPQLNRAMAASNLNVSSQNREPETEHR